MGNVGRSKHHCLQRKSLAFLCASRKAWHSTNLLCFPEPVFVLVTDYLYRHILKTREMQEVLFSNPTETNDSHPETRRRHFHFTLSPENYHHDIFIIPLLPQSSNTLKVITQYNPPYALLSFGG
jgi:hypothetical protein